MDRSPRRVLIACGSNWDAPGRLPAVFAQAGCRVTVLCDPESALFKTRHAAERHAAPPSLEGHIEMLGRHLMMQSRPYDWVVVTDDPLLDALVVRRPPWLASWFPIDPDSPAIRLMASKIGFCEIASEAKIPLPRWTVSRSAAEAQRGAERLGFPVVVKKDMSFGGLGVMAARDPAELSRAVTTLADGRAFALQELVEGRLGNSVALFARGRPIAWMSAYKTRTWPGPFGPSSARTFVEPPDVEPILQRLGAACGYHGFGAIDWIERKDGRLVVLELNARPVPAIQMGSLVGVDFARAILTLLDDDGDRAVQRPTVTPTLATQAIPMFPQDFYRAITECDEAAFSAWASGDATFDDVPWDDAPLLAHYVRRRSVRRHFERVFRASERDSTSLHEELIT